MNLKKGKKKMKARYNNEDVMAVQTMYKSEKKRNGGKNSQSPPKVIVPDRSSSRE